MSADSPVLRNDATNPADPANRRCFVFAGGGTGGHLYPGLAIAEHLRDLAPARGVKARCVFACSTRPLDAAILRDEHADFVPIPAEPFGVRPMTAYRFITSWGGAVRSGRALIHDLRAANARVDVIAMGGFVAAPMVQAARAERCPVTLVNLDAAPGKANQWIARRATRIFTSAEVQRRGWVHVPPVVRRAAMPPGDQAACRAKFGLDPSRPTLLVTGASQGAHSINEFVRRFLEEQGEVLTRGRWQVIHQAGGRADLESLSKTYETTRIPAVVRAFLSPMGPAWGAADLAVSRAGAGSVAEAWASGVPTLFMPYPHHRDEHQRLNAEPLERGGCARIVRDQIDPGANLRDAGTVLDELLAGAEKRATMRRSFAALGPADGAVRIARAILTR